MIRVIEHGKRKVTCPYCKARLEYESEDVMTSLEDLLDTVDTGYDYIICPDCNKQIKV